MIAAAGQFRDWDIALLIIVLCLAMFTREIVSRVRAYFRDRDLARQITREHEARKALEKLSR